MESSGPVLIAYDGSDNARAAIDSVAPILKGAPAVVVYARHPLEGNAAHLEGRPRFEDVAARNSDRLDDSERIAAEGADRARAAATAGAARAKEHPMPRLQPLTLENAGRSRDALAEIAARQGRVTAVHQRIHIVAGVEPEDDATARSGKAA